MGNFTDFSHVFLEKIDGFLAQKDRFWWEFKNLLGMVYQSWYLANLGDVLWSKWIDVLFFRAQRNTSKLAVLSKFGAWE